MSTHSPSSSSEKPTKKPVKRDEISDMTTKLAETSLNDADEDSKRFAFKSKNDPKFAFRSMVLMCPSSRNNDARSKRLSASPVSMDLDGVIDDFQAMQKFLTKTVAARVSENGNCGNISKDDFLKRVSNFLSERTDQTDYYFLVLSGHGDEEGQFCVGQNEYESVECQEVLNTWKESTARRSNSRLLIVCDFCSSGSWVEYLQANQERYPDVAIQSSCDSREICEDEGSFLKCWMQSGFQLFEFVNSDKQKLHPKMFVGWKPKARQCQLPLGNKAMIMTFFIGT